MKITEVRIYMIFLLAGMLQLCDVVVVCDVLVVWRHSCILYY